MNSLPLSWFFPFGFSRRMLVICDCFHLSTCLQFMVWRNFSRNFLHSLVLSLRFPESTLKISSLSQSFPQRPHQTEMTPSKKSKSQVAVVPHQKSSRRLLGAWSLPMLICPILCSHQRIKEIYSSSAIAPEAGTNGHETWLPA